MSEKEQVKFSIDETIENLIEDSMFQLELSSITDILFHYNEYISFILQTLNTNTSLLVLNLHSIKEYEYFYYRGVLTRDCWGSYKKYISDQNLRLLSDILRVNTSITILRKLRGVSRLSGVLCCS